jgi:CDGSH-type Zn-finger protein
MTDPVIFQKSPMPIEVEEGKTYFWCACGKSAKQPFCDGSHKDTGIAPVKITAAATKKMFFRTSLQHKNKEEINMYNCAVRFGELTNWPLKTIVLAPDLD